MFLLLLFVLAHKTLYIKRNNKQKENKMKTTFTNDFHNTSITLVAKKSYANNLYTLSKGQVAKCRKALCGINGCTCGNNVLKERGNSNLTVCDNGDGSVDFYYTF